jgi:protein-disulfide isomerase
MKNKKAILFGSWIGILVALTLLVNWLSNSSMTAQKPPQPPKIDNAVVKQQWDAVMAHTVGTPKGDPKAPYTIVEFGDFCCPQCGAMHSVFENLPTSAPVNVYFVNRPFPKLKEHENAVVAAEAGYAAAAQGKFWPMFDQLYGHQKNLEPYNYEEYANSAGLNGATLHKDVESGKYLKQVEDSEQFCDKIGMQMTPSIALHDNKTGDIKTAAGREQINKLLSSAPWTKNGAGPAVAKGQ